MFNIFRKKSQVQHLIDTDGIEHATDRFAEIICRKLPSQRIAYQFILEELDGASKGNEVSKAFALNSGIAHIEYSNSLQNSIPEVDGPDGPQQLLLSLSLQLARNSDQMANFRCKIDDKIMRRFKFGKYSVDITHDLIKLDRKYMDLSSMMVVALNQGQIRIVDQDGALNMLKEALRQLSPQEILGCRNAVACFFTIAHLAESAFQAKNQTIAKYVSSRCKPIAKSIMEIPQDNYSNLEFSLIDAAFDILKKIDGYSS